MYLGAGCRMNSNNNYMGILNPYSTTESLSNDMKFATHAQTISRYIDNGNIHKFINLIVNPITQLKTNLPDDFEKTGFLDMTHVEMEQLIECSNVPQCMEPEFRYNNKITQRQIVVKGPTLENVQGPTLENVQGPAFNSNTDTYRRDLISGRVQIPQAPKLQLW